MFSKLADTVMKHSKAIIALWIVVLCCALPFGLKSGDVLVYDMNELPGSSNEASEGQDIIDEYFTNTIDLSEILVISYDDAEEAALASAVYTEFASRMSAELGDKGFTVSDYGSYSKDSTGYPGIELIAIGCTDKDYDVVDETENIRSIVKNSVNAVSGADALNTYVTGNDALTHDTMTSSTEDVSKIDPMSIILIFVLLGLFFYAIVTAVIPPAVVGMSYGIVLLLLYVIGNMIMRTIVHGVSPNYKDIDWFYYGTAESGYLASVEDVMLFLLDKKVSRVSTLSFGPLSYQPYSRNLDRDPRDESKRFIVQIKWPQMADDMKVICSAAKYGLFPEKAK